jgi:hypothetical protein
LDTYVTENIKLNNCTDDGQEGHTVRIEPLLLKHISDFFLKFEILRIKNHANFSRKIKPESGPGSSNGSGSLLI